MLNKPPPYFPQGQLNPPDPKRYLRFKLIVAIISVMLILGLIGIGWGIYYLVTWLF